MPALGRPACNAGASRPTDNRSVRSCGRFPPPASPIPDRAAASSASRLSRLSCRKRVVSLIASTTADPRTSFFLSLVHEFGGTGMRRPSAPIESQDRLRTASWLAAGFGDRCASAGRTAYDVDVRFRHTVYVEAQAPLHESSPRRTDHGSPSSFSSRLTWPVVETVCLVLAKDFEQSPWPKDQRAPPPLRSS